MSNMEENVCRLDGILYRDSELKETRTGKKLLTFGIMYNTRNTTDSEGSHANFIDVEAWGNLAEHFGSILIKGNKVKLVGVISQQRWTDQNGYVKSTFRFIANEITIVKERKEI